MLRPSVAYGQFQHASNPLPFLDSWAALMTTFKTGSVLIHARACHARAADGTSSGVLVPRGLHVGTIGLPWANQCCQHSNSSVSLYLWHPNSTCGVHLSKAMLDACRALPCTSCRWGQQRGPSSRGTACWRRRLRPGTTTRPWSTGAARPHSSVATPRIPGPTMGTLPQGTMAGGGPALRRASPGELMGLGKMELRRVELNRLRGPSEEGPLALLQARPSAQVHPHAQLFDQPFARSNGTSNTTLLFGQWTANMSRHASCKVVASPESHALASFRSLQEQISVQVILSFSLGASAVVDNYRYLAVIFIPRPMLRTFLLEESLFHYS